MKKLFILICILLLFLSCDSDVEKSIEYVDSDIECDVCEVCEVCTSTEVDSATFTITFDPQNGDAVFTVEVTEGELITKPPTSEYEKEDNINNGMWYKDVSGTYAWDFDNDIVTKNLTLNISWAITGYRLIGTSTNGLFVDDYYTEYNWSLTDDRRCEITTYDSDDVPINFNVKEHDASYNVTKDITYTAGIDGLWLTVDDEIESIVVKKYSVLNFVRSFIVYNTPGASGIWDDGDDGINYGGSISSTVEFRPVF